jgi:hypothetical protein
MSSKSRADAAPAAQRSPKSKRQDKRAARRRAALEVKLASADRLIEKRRTQLHSASTRRASIAAKLARVPSPSGETESPMAYCIKDRQRVAIGGAHVVMLTNGRPAIAGLCPSCGSKVVRLGAA